MKYRAVIFDLDGTLIDTEKDIGHYINLILSRYSYPLIDPGKVSSIVGWGLRDAMEKALPAGVNDKKLIDSYTDELIYEYSLNPVIDTYIYEGIPALLESLRVKGIKSAVFSNKAHPVTERIVEILFSKGTFEHVRGAVQGFPKKPDPAGAILIAGKMGLSPCDVLYMGDSDVDSVTAGRGGFRFIAALWGYRSRRQLEDAGAVDFIGSPGELEAFLE